MTLLRNKALLNNPLLSPTARGSAYGAQDGSASAANLQRYSRELSKQRVEPFAISGGVESVDALPSLPDTDYPEGAVVFLTTDDKLYRNTDGSTWSRAIDGGDVTANTLAVNALTSGTISTADIVIGSGGNIRQGQTDYDTGTGFWLGDDSGTPKFSIGSDVDNALTWDGSNLTVRGAGTFQTDKTFDTVSIGGFTTSTWGGGVNDVFNYFTAPDQLVMLYTTSFASATSNANTFTWTVPSSSLFPGGSRHVVCAALDNGSPVSALAHIASSGAVTMYILSSGTFVSDGWTTSGTKGFPHGVPLCYPL